MLNHFHICQIRNNTTVTDKVNNWNILPLEEAYVITTPRLSLNCGLNGFKELQLLIYLLFLFEKTFQ